jgi:hypothetical protein
MRVVTRLRSKGVVAWRLGEQTVPLTFRSESSAPLLATLGNLAPGGLQGDLLCSQCRSRGQLESY